MDEINKTKYSFNILAITNSADKHSAMDFLKKYYFRDEPLNASIGLLKEKEFVIKLENFLDTFLHNGEWHTAYDRFTVINITYLTWSFFNFSTNRYT